MRNRLREVKRGERVTSVIERGNVSRDYAAGSRNSFDTMTRGIGLTKRLPRSAEGGGGNARAWREIKNPLADECRFDSAAGTFVKLEYTCHLSQVTARSSEFRAA